MLRPAIFCAALAASACNLFSDDSSGAATGAADAAADDDAAAGEDGGAPPDGGGAPACEGPFVVDDEADVDAIDECVEIVGKLTINLPGTTVELPVLGLLRGDLTMFTSFSAPVLARVEGHILGEPDAVAVSLPALTTAYSVRLGRKRSWTETIDLSSLTTVSGGAGPWSGFFVVSNAKELATLSLPSLRSISGHFAIYGNGSGFTTTQLIEAPLLESIGGGLHIDSHEELTAIDFSSLTSIDPDGSFEIYGNETLPNCYATVLLERLQANGFDGSVYVYGNGTGTCPP